MKLFRRKPRSVAGVAGISVAQRQELAKLGIREADQLACLSSVRSELLSRVLGSGEGWTGASLRRARGDRSDLATRLRSHRPALGVVRGQHPGGIGAPVAPAVRQKLAEQRTRHAGLPEEIDHAAAMPFVHGQGANPSCVGHAATGVLEFASREVLSGSYLYLRCKEIDGEPDGEGTTLAAAVKSLGAGGTCRLKTWPGADQEGVDLATLDAPDATAVSEARGFRANEAACAPLNSIEEIQGALAYGLDGVGHPVLVAVPVFGSWDAAFRTGSVPMRLGGGDVCLGWHAVLLTGYRKDNDDPGGGRFYFLNSWGEDWAADSPIRAGFGSLPFAYLQEYEAESWFIDPMVTAVAHRRPAAAPRLLTVGLILAAIGSWWVGGMLRGPPAIAENVVVDLPVASRPETTIPTSRSARAFRLDAPRIESSWETLDAENRQLDHDAAEYVRAVVGRLSEIRPSYPGAAPKKDEDPDHGLNQP